MSRSRTERIEKTEREGKEEEREERKEKERKMDRGRSRDGEHRLLLGCVKKTPRTCKSPHVLQRAHSARLSSSAGWVKGIPWSGTIE